MGELQTTLRVRAESDGDFDLRDTQQLEGRDGMAAITSLPSAERYRLGRELGRGGMGRVVEAYDVQLGRTVALKEALPKSGAEIAQRFAREAQLTARLDHPSIVPLYDAGMTIDGRPFYVMRRLSGRPLDHLMREAPGPGERLTLLPAVQAAIDAVAHAHRRGVIHRDLKPANILVGELGETAVIDWGLAEQARGEPLDLRSDVYALGATLYQLLSGAPPQIVPGALAVRPVEEVAPGAPPELVAIVGKATAFEPSNRYPDAGALGDDVRRFVAGQLIAAHRYTPRQRLWRLLVAIARRWWSPRSLVRRSSS